MLQNVNQALIGGIVLTVLIVSTVFSVTMSQGIFDGGYEVTADFVDAAGLSSGDSVLVAGVRVGGVRSVEIEGEHARATFTVDTELPADTRAEIVLRNFLGKRALFLLPDGDWETPLQEGDHIPVERTDTPLDFQDLNQAVTEIVHEQDIDSLSRLVGLLADTIEGTGDDVGRLLDGLDTLTEVVAQQKDELHNVIVDTNTVVGALAESDDELVTLIDGFGQVLERLAARRTELQQLLAVTADATTEGAGLLEDVRPQLDRVLDELHRDLEIVDDHQVDIAHAFAYGGVAFEGFANTFKSGDQPNGGWQNVMVTSQGEVGVDHLFGCGGELDKALDQVLGPDPRSCEEQSGTVAENASAEGASVTWPTSSWMTALTHAQRAHGHEGGAA